MANSTLSPILTEHYYLSVEEMEIVRLFRSLSADSKRIVLRRAEDFSRWDALTSEQQDDLIKKVPDHL